MTTITTTRVNGHGAVTGTADLSVTREGDVVTIKLGLIRVELWPPAQDRLIAAIKGEEP